MRKHSDLERPGPIIVYANPAFEQMTGWTAREVIGQTPSILQGASTDLSIFRRGHNRHEALGFCHRSLPGKVRHCKLNRPR
ncbi:PAS domain-containing protein [Microvirga yunnanensis]|uniref:PAS domain-containing protein n=1 Tax=Microvirga yunnanensis TaxID=2953740 RepID=UPI0029056B97|nr:PAS domain-containing protein [Microvirga sp. HBU65207]